MSSKKKKRRKLKLTYLPVLFLGLTICVSLICTLFIKTYKISLSHQLHKAQQQIETISLENTNLSLTIQSMASHSRVLEIAKENGLADIVENMFFVKTTEE